MSRYKTFFVQFSKVGFLSILVVLLLVGAVSYSFKNKKTENAYAINGKSETGATQLSGFAWSENIGWISFNSANCDSDGDGKSNGATGCQPLGDTVSPYEVGATEMSIGVNRSIARLSGHAWADKDHLGWISFYRKETGNPPALTPVYDPGTENNYKDSENNIVLAYLDEDNKLQGWARATSACDNNNDGDCVDSGNGEGVGAGTNSGGWDGWIALGDAKPSANPVYGVSLDLTTKQFKGWASGGSNPDGVIGWVSFNKLNCDVNGNNKLDVGECGNVGPSTPDIGDYKVATTFELNKTPDVVTAGNMDIKTNPNSSYCGAGSITFEWKFSDPNLDTPNNQMSKYKLEASYDNSNFKIIRETTTTYDNNSIVSVTVPLSEIKSDLDGNNWYNQTLYWKVTVYDGGFGNKSATSETDSYNLPDNEYVVNFDSNPPFNNIFAEQVVQFFDKSKVYNSSNPNGKDLNMDNVTTACGSNCSRTWDFSVNGNPRYPNPQKANPTTMFIEDIATDVKLTFGDKDRYGASYSCSKSESVAVKFPIPKFEEKK